MASVKKNSNGGGISTRSGHQRLKSQFLVCVDNRGYEASLERNKIYRAVRDLDAERSGDVRIVDESGEDYLYSKKRFVPIEVPASVKPRFASTPQHNSVSQTVVEGSFDRPPTSTQMSTKYLHQIASSCI